MKELDEIDQLFQTTFEGFESAPDPLVKLAIDRAIASKKKRRRLFFWFPVLFGTAVLAAVLYFGTGQEGQEIQAVSNVQRAQTDEKDQEIQTAQNSNPYSIPSGGANVKTAIQQTDRTPFKQATQKQIRSIKRNTTKYGEKRNFEPGTLLTPAKMDDSETPDPEIAVQSLVRPADSASGQPETNTIENNPDSLTASTSGDSAAVTNLTTSTDEPGLVPEVKKEDVNWTLSVIAGWENEPRKPAERFDSLNLSLVSNQFARIQSTAFYGKIELNRRINARFSALIGLGFHAAKITQYGSVHSLDSFPITEGVGSSPLPQYAYFTRQQNEVRVSQVNSVILPLGVSYSAPLGNEFRFRISGGTQFAYSWMTEKQAAPQLTAPEFRAFGLNAWLRPEIHYNFGKFQLFGFGTFNQALVRQLKWDFEVRRNPAFGAGIGMLIPL